MRGEYGVLKFFLRPTEIIGWRSAPTIFLGLCLGIGILTATASEAHAQPPDAANAVQRAQQQSVELAQRMRSAVVAVVPDGTDLGSAHGIAGGSGFVISADGLILTALVNLSGTASSATVVFAGGEAVRARVLGRDPANAVALLKAENIRTPIRPLEFADSRRVVVGQTAYTFGNPYSSIVNDDQVAMSRGAVSGVYRPHITDGRGTAREHIGLYAGPVIETTASVNDGNWGGPLTDREGRVLGVVVKLISYRRWLGCAVPIHQIRLVLEHLTHGRALPSAVSGITATAASAADNAPGAARITAVAAAGAAEEAGLLVGDVIVKVDTEALTAGGTQLDQILTALPPGGRVVVMVRRDEAVRFVELWLRPSR